MKQRFLTKSRFKVGHECPTKLYYLDRPEYSNKKNEAPFLEALADGGFQVGALAKIYFPNGVEVTTRNHEDAWTQTQTLLLQNDECTIFEAALKFEGLFVRVDILRKKGKFIELIEVKAKSFNPETDAFASYDKKTGALKNLKSNWEPYLLDIAFQKHVAQLALPEFSYRGFLMLADKSKKASISGLHQKFLIKKTDSSTDVLVESGTSRETIGEKILGLCDVEEYITFIFNQKYEDLSFKDYVLKLSAICIDGKFTNPTLSRHCGKCEYRDKTAKSKGLQNGFEQCWTTNRTIHANQLEEPFIFDLWRLHWKKADSLLAQKRFFIKDISEIDLETESQKSDPTLGLSAKMRQWKQVEAVKFNRNDSFIDVEGLAYEMSKWKFPLHFIDFETITAAIPFYQGIRPYETVAFQFSHHTVQANGNVHHQTEYINTMPGAFPNFEFVRALMKAINNDEGTVFRYATHENTVLKHIKRQLQESDENDREVLIAFINTLIVEKPDNKTIIAGSRAMVDLHKLVLLYFYSPAMGGSNSIKKVLPAILNESKYLKEKYSSSIYGSEKGITSHNFRDKTWIIFNKDNGTVLDPYKNLEPIFQDLNLDSEADSHDDEDEMLFHMDKIAEGGAASTAYARMQFTQMNENERQKITAALLKYCELDTLSMVMIYEHWREAVRSAGLLAA